MSQRRTKSKMLPEFEFKVNVRYDQEFRSRDANQRLRKNHPKVKKIHVKSRDGNSYVKVIIAAPTRAIAKACFDEGNARVLKRQGNNSRRPRTNSRKQRTNSRRTRTNSRRTRTNTRKQNTREAPSKPKTPSPENTRPIHYFSEDVTPETDWGEFMTRCDEYQKKHPEVKVIC